MHRLKLLRKWFLLNELGFSHFGSNDKSVIRAHEPGALPSKSCESDEQKSATLCDR